MFLKMVYTLHIDLDAFYASVEQRDNPELRGTPVGVVTGVRGPIAASSYEAKAFGVKSGMPVSDALDLCPNLTLINRNQGYYERESAKFISICERYGARVLRYGPDEAWVDASDNVTSLEEAVNVAMNIKYNVRDEMGITASAGISEDNKLLAKQGSDLDKPDGLTVLLQSDVPEKLYPLPVRNLYMVGESRESALKKLGVETIGDLASLPRELLVPYFKRFVGNLLFNYSHGIEDPQIEKFVYSGEERKSLSHSRTLDRDRRDFSFLDAVIYTLSVYLTRDLQNLGMQTNRIYTFVRFEDFSGNQRLGRFQHPTYSLSQIYQNSRNALQHLLDIEPQNKKVRALGIRATNFVRNEEIDNEVSQLELMLS